LSFIRGKRLVYVVPADLKLFVTARRLTIPPVVLHDQSQILELVLQNRQRAPGHFHSANCVSCRLRRDSVAPAHQENLYQLRRLAGIGQAPLQQVIP
jgi:hypothetical protein